VKRAALIVFWRTFGNLIYPGLESKGWRYRVYIWTQCKLYGVADDQVWEMRNGKHVPEPDENA
jgi:hypothetical protein